MGDEWWVRGVVSERKACVRVKGRYEVEMLKESESVKVEGKRRRAKENERYDRRHVVGEGDGKRKKSVRESEGEVRGGDSYESESGRDEGK